MARHRDFQSKNYDDEMFSDNDDDYSDEEQDSGVETPYVYNRFSNRNKLAAYFCDEEQSLKDCVMKVRDILGADIPEADILESSRRLDFDAEKVIDHLLNLQLNTNAEPSTSNENRRVEKAKTKPATRAMPTTNGAKPKPVVKPKLKRKASSEEQPNDIKTSTVQEKEAPACIISKQQNQRDVLQLYATDRGARRTEINMVVIGHVDAGKSTLMGRLLFDLGFVSAHTLNKFTQLAATMHKQSFVYAWVMDKTDDERQHGVTIEVATARFETKTKAVTILDAPGHKDFIPNMISGAAQADVALLVIDARPGEFETAFDQGGQTREHTILARSLGVGQLAIVINKLDVVKYSQTRFTEIVSKLKPFLKQVGFKLEDIVFVPCSGMTGVNLCKQPDNATLTSWYKGPTLLEVIDGFKAPTRPIEKPLRFSVTEVNTEYVATWLTGSIESGTMCVNDTVLVDRTGEYAQITALKLGEESLESAFAGEHVSIAVTGVDDKALTVGTIICDPLKPIPVASRFEARIAIFSAQKPIALTIGYRATLHIQCIAIQAVVSKISAVINKSNGEVIKKNPRAVSDGSCALVEITTTKPICVERYADIQAFGRFTLRVKEVTVAAGMITKIM